MENIEKGDLITTGKAKSLYSSKEEDYLIMHYRDDTSAFDGKKIESLEGKGTINNKFNAFIMEYLEKEGIPTHFEKLLSETDSLVKKLEMAPVECVVRNVAAGSICKRLGLEEGASIAKLSNNVFPCLIDVHLKNDELHDPLISQDIAQALNIVSEKDLNMIVSLTHSINYFLQDYMRPKNIEVIDFKLEFGHDVENKIRLGDEITPDSCRFWEIGTGRKMDKDRFRRNLGLVEETYKELEYTIVGQENS